MSGCRLFVSSCTRSATAVLAIAAATAGSLAAQDERERHDHGAAPEDWVPESVDMAASASDEARLFLNRGIEALHNFWYEAAREAFREAQQLEPDFVLAAWGEAFSHHSPFGFSGGDRKTSTVPPATSAPYGNSGKETKSSRGSGRIG